MILALGALFLLVRAVAPRVSDDLIRPVTSGVPVAGEVDAGCAPDCAALQHIRRPTNDGGSVDYRMGFVEIDDEGRFRDRQQLENAMAVARDLGRPNGLVLLAYVHGWNHDARPGDRDIRCVGEVAAAMSRVQAAGGSGRETMALYVGWRGNEFTNSVMNKTTFLGRLDAVDRIGVRGAMRELFIELGKLKADLDQEVIVVLVGHSLGARVVFLALRPFLETGLLLEQDPPDAVDLALMINPAFSGVDFEFLSELPDSSDWGGPPVVVAASENDRVTRQLYPFAFGFRGFRGIRGRVSSDDSLQVHAIGTLKSMRTHVLSTDVASGELGPVQGGACDAVFGARQLHSPDGRLDYDRIAAIRPSTMDSMAVDTLGWMTLEPSILRPISVIGVDEALVPDHNGIWGPEFTDFVVRVVNDRVFRGGR